MPSVPRHLSWRGGHGAFSIGQSSLDALQRYIATQTDHHKTRDFKAEFRALLAKHGVEYDERHVWG